MGSRLFLVVGQVWKERFQGRQVVVVVRRLGLSSFMGRMGQRLGQFVILWQVW
jgi:hypothetical protein